MSLSAEQPSIWTPEVIATIIYRIVMILVSLAFIWKKYRRPTRQIDEEKLIGVLLPSYKPSLDGTISANGWNAENEPTRTSPLHDAVVASIGDVIQSAVGLDGADRPFVSFEGPSGDESSTGSSLDTDVGLDIELGDLGLRHRSADNTLNSKKKSLQHSIVKD